MASVSVVIITRNEAARIRRCLDSVAGWAGEIIVVDSQSEDATTAIAAEYGARIHVRPWPGFATQKNFGIDQAACDWVLVLDADEQVSGELQAEIAALLAGQPQHPLYRIPRKNYLGDTWLAHGGMYPDLTPRLFRRGQARYGEREIHEVLVCAGTRGKLKGPIVHQTYADLAAYIDKVNRYTTLEAQDFCAKGRKVPWWYWLQPLGRFFKNYVRKKGYKDGFKGFASAVLLAIYPLFIHLKMLERQGPRRGL